ncbi:exodeoxyribonuclease VII small subunit [Myxococcota bacterium]|nr:exodeoxyribonuclease VII small subunit [Myxococcota bacterium]MBU1433273.1 exodeoxyribonuclease VII small subunit [Myxococcota bacterium]MBU1897267.1 exodeoxyribonuclease VII small subunit [Myxococcota bacterium]
MSTPERAPRFEDVLAELRRLVERLEGGQLALDEALGLYERGVALSRHGHQLLEGVERRIEILRAGPEGRADQGEGEAPRLEPAWRDD